MFNFTNLRLNTISSGYFRREASWKHMSFENSQFRRSVLYTNSYSKHHLSAVEVLKASASYVTAIASGRIMPL